MSESWQHCVVCGAYLPPEQTVYDVRVFLDPMPERGYACSARCAERAENDGKMRVYLTLDLLNKG